MENQIHIGIGQNTVKCLEAVNVTGLEDTCKWLQASIDELASNLQTYPGTL